jgi:hypothetical protein
MITDISEKISQLPLDKQKEVEDYIDFLISKYKIEVRTTEQSLSEFRKKNMAKGQSWMDDDFIETPGDF